MKPLPPQTVSLLSSALMSTNGTARIESALAQELATAGWIASVRAMVTALVRSGECTTYEEVMGRVRGAIRAQGTTGDAKRASSVVVNGGEARVLPEGVGGVAVPREVVVEGMRMVRSEVERVCELRVDDVDG